MMNKEKMRKLMKEQINVNDLIDMCASTELTYHPIATTD